MHSLLLLLVRHELVPHAEWTLLLEVAPVYLHRCAGQREVGQLFLRGPFRQVPSKKLVHKWYFLSSEILEVSMSSFCLILAGELLLLSGTSQ